MPTSRLADDAGGDNSFTMIPNWLQWAGAKPMDIAVFMALYQFANASRKCNPSYGAIGKLAGVSESAVRRSLEKLRKLGAVSWSAQYSSGRQTSNEYRIQMANPGYANPRKQTPVACSPEDTRLFTSEHPACSPVSTPGCSPVNTKLEPYELELIEPPIVPQGGTRIKYPPEFEAFWKAYPRRVEKQRAYKAFQKAIDKVSPETLIDGATRYANDPNRSDKFTKHPATWLNAGCWEDEILETTARAVPKTSTGSDVFDQFLTEMVQQQERNNDGRLLASRRHGAHAIESSWPG